MSLHSSKYFSWSANKNQFKITLRTSLSRHLSFFSRSVDSIQHNGYCQGLACLEENDFLCRLCLKLIFILSLNLNTMQRFFGNKPQDVSAEEELVSLVGGRRVSDSDQRPSSSTNTIHLTLSVKGMHCSSCSSAIENALKYV